MCRSIKFQQKPFSSRQFFLTPEMTLPLSTVSVLIWGVGVRRRAERKTEYLGARPWAKCTARSIPSDRSLLEGGYEIPTFRMRRPRLREPQASPQNLVARMGWSRSAPHPFLSLLLLLSPVVIMADKFRSKHCSIPPRNCTVVVF